VTGVGVEGHVGNHAKARLGRLDGAHGALHQAIRVPGFVGTVALAGCIDDREQCDRRYPQFNEFLCLFEQQVDADTLDIGHRFDRFAALLAVEYEHRVNEIAGVKAMLTHQAPGKVVTAHAPFAGVRITGHAFVSVAGE